MTYDKIPEGKYTLKTSKPIHGDGLYYELHHENGYVYLLTEDDYRDMNNKLYDTSSPTR